PSIDLLIYVLCANSQTMNKLFTCYYGQRQSESEWNMEDEARTRRKNFASKSARSVSAPSRKKWYKRMPMSMRRMGSQQNLCDQNFNHVSRRLVGAIATWHDIHANLLRLSFDRGKQSTSSEEEDLSSCSEYFSCYSASSSRSSDSLHDEEQMHETDDASHEDVPKNKLRSRLSLSNPELTNLQLKAMFPEVSNHWRSSRQLVNAVQYVCRVG
uniref:Uncharacterized protein n=1 Tax=Parascaris univalens TaxID=6257 RepID=A0A915C3T9_PARUN